MSVEFIRALNIAQLSQPYFLERSSNPDCGVRIKGASKIGNSDFCFEASFLNWYLYVEDSTQIGQNTDEIKCISLQIQMGCFVICRLETTLAVFTNFTNNQKLNFSSLPKMLRDRYKLCLYIFVHLLHCKLTLSSFFTARLAAFLHQIVTKASSFEFVVDIVVVKVSRHSHCSLLCMIASLSVASRFTFLLHWGSYFARCGVVNFWHKYFSVFIIFILLFLNSLDFNYNSNNNTTNILIEQ